MARYIDVDDVAQRIMYYMSHVPERCGEHYAYKAALKEIVGSPTADVEEVKHGEWVPIVKQDSYLDPPYCDIIKCSECEEEADVSFHDAKYCYNCGAKMDGGKK